MKRRSRWGISLLVVIGAFVALRLALPWILEEYVNRQLAALEGYWGQVEDVDVALWRGAYQIQGVQIEKENKEEESREPFFTATLIDLSIDWGRLLDGAVVAEVIFSQPQLNVIQSEDKDESQTGEDVSWSERLDKLFPFRFNSIVVDDGTVRFRTPLIESEQALVVQNIEGVVQNLTNVVKAEDNAFARFEFSSRILGAPLMVAGRANPTAEQPTFDLNLRLDKVRMTDLNPWLRAYLNADAQGGTFALYTEIAASDGNFEGYAKPFAEQLDLYDLGENTKGILHSAWEATLNLAAEIFENQPEDEVATRIPIGGTLENPQIGIVQTVLNVLRNAIAGSFTRSLEGTVSLPDEEEEDGAESN